LKDIRIMARCFSADREVIQGDALLAWQVHLQRLKALLDVSKGENWAENGADELHKRFAGKSKPHLCRASIQRGSWCAARSHFAEMCLTCASAYRHRWRVRAIRVP